MLLPKRKRAFLTKKKKSNYRIPFSKMVLNNSDASDSSTINSATTMSVTFGLKGVRNNSDEDILKAIRKISKGF